VKSITVEFGLGEFVWVYSAFYGRVTHERVIAIEVFDSGREPEYTTLSGTSSSTHGALQVFRTEEEALAARASREDED